MLNEVILFGIVEEIIEEKNPYIILKVERSFKNNVGVFEIDYIKCYLWNGAVENIIKNYKLKSLLCVRGRIQVEEKNLCYVVIEKIQYLGKSQ